MIDDDGTAMFRFKMPDHGPMAAAAVDSILKDMRNQKIETITDGTFIRKRRTGGEEVVWSGRVSDSSKVPQARRYLERLSISVSGRS
jgi:hypothetical protein